jgi:glycerol-3-phosphate dehydrogenase (NAD(P)+)
VTRAIVLGTGAWGTTFAAVLGDAGTDTILWGNEVDAIEEIAAHHTNHAYTGDRVLPANVTATLDAHQAFHNVDMVFLALPAQSARDIVGGLAPLVPKHARVASLMKGIEVGTHLRMTEVLSEVWDISEDRLVVVSGPNLSDEIAQKQPTATVVASHSDESAKVVADAIASAYFRPYTNPDVVGVELCGAYKNVIAVAVGIADGRGLGFNTTATIITRGLAEIQRLGLALGAQPETFAGLAGVGDLIATCTSPLSRNHTLGKRIGEGLSLDDAIRASRGTAEGAQTSLSVRELARVSNVDVPICEAVVAMLHEGAAVERIMGTLLSRPRKAEVE